MSDPLISDERRPASPVYDCGDPDCGACRRAFGPDRRKAIAQFEAREIAYEQMIIAGRGASQ